MAMAKVGKRIRDARAKVDRNKAYPLEEAIKLVKEASSVKFDETVDIALNLGVDPKHADQVVRGVCQLPNGSGRTVRVAVFARGAKADEAKEAGADIVGAEDLFEQVQRGEINFDRCIATPDMMGVVGRLGRVLGPRGLMPNPKLGTVTPNVTQAVKDAKGGQVQFRVEKAGIIHAPIGKTSMAPEQIAANLNELIATVMRLKPSTAKGVYLKGVALSTTMGPGIKLDNVAIANAFKG